ncbi:MAG: 50S ribosomal protein L23 [Nanoarchaeota archaeon]
MAADKNVEEVFKKELSKQFYDVVEKVIVSEKATRLIEFENKLTFEVARYASKPMIKLLIENEFGKKVKSVKTMNAINGKKRAIVAFVDEGAAGDLASTLEVF